jgi:serine/threonine-protein kinase RsbW
VPSPDINSPLEERQVGGLGIYLIMNLMDEVHFTFDPQDGNLLTMTKLMTVELQRDTVTIPLQGRIDATTSPELQRTVQARIASGARFVLLTFEQVTFLSSSGLRALLLIRKELLALGGELRLAELQPNIHELFVLTGFTQVFAIHVTTEDAHRAFGQGRA